jgi:hypothetical protein
VVGLAAWRLSARLRGSRWVAEHELPAVRRQPGTACATHVVKQLCPQFLHSRMRCTRVHAPGSYAVHLGKTSAPSPSAGLSRVWCARSGGSAPTAGPGLLLSMAEGGSYAAIGLGLAVLALQVCAAACDGVAVPMQHHPQRLPSAAVSCTPKALLYTACKSQSRLLGRCLSGALCPRRCRTPGATGRAAAPPLRCRPAPDPARYTSPAASPVQPPHRNHLTTAVGPVGAF